MSAILPLLTLLALPAAAPMSKPANFADGKTVLASIDAGIAACGSAGAAACKSSCETARRLAASALGQTKPNLVAVENHWKMCQRSVDEALAAGPGPFDARTVKINGFQLGGDVRAQQGRFQMLQARGYVKALKADNTVRLVFQGKAEAGASTPDVVLEYSGISEDGGFTTVDAAGDGRIWKLRHVVKGKPDAAAVRAAAVRQHGEPHQVQGDMLMWGCKPQNNENCYIVEILPHQVEYRAIDERLKVEWAPRYQSALAEARR